MVTRWSAAAVAKAKVAAVVATSLAAGGVGGAVALSHVAPATRMVTQTAATPAGQPQPTQDPESVDATGQGASPTAAGSASAHGHSSQVPGPPSSQDPGPAGAGTPAACPSGAANHGQYVASVARSAPKGKGSAHGDAVSTAARSDCGKPAASGPDQPGTPARPSKKPKHGPKQPGGAAPHPSARPPHSSPGSASDPTASDGAASDGTASHGHGQGHQGDGTRTQQAPTGGTSPDASLSGSDSGAGSGHGNGQHSH